MLPLSEIKPVKSYYEAAGKGLLYYWCHSADLVWDAVQCAVKEEDRTKNLIIFGAKESREDEPETSARKSFST